MRGRMGDWESGRMTEDMQDSKTARLQDNKRIVITFVISAYQRSF